MTKSQPTVLVLSGGKGVERTISLKSGRMVVGALDRKRFRVMEATLTPRLDLVLSRTGERWRFLDGFKKIQALHVDCIFPALHGEFGEDGQLQTLLELLGIPFVGSGSVASCAAMDKGISQALFAEAGFHVPRSYTMRTVDDMPGLKIFLQQEKKVVVKPLRGGSSLGVFLSGDAQEIRRRILSALRKNQPMMVNEYLQGREMTCGVIEKSARHLLPLIPTEIRPKGSVFFDYHAKYAVAGAEEITPPDLSRPQINDLQTWAARAHRLLGCRGLSRSDFIFLKGRFYILETNTLPGLTKTSLLPQGAQACGIHFTDLLTILIERALQK